MTRIFLSLICLLQITVMSAFRPIGHVILKDEIVASLPKNNKFRMAMEKYPHIAAWGSVGPDLAYNPDLSRLMKTRFKRQMKNSMLMADIAHYHNVGTFTTNLVEEATRRNDEKFFAFVGGWITHIAGDFASHGTLVKPEAGYYITCENKRDLHGNLEQFADFLLYQKYSDKYGLPDNLLPESCWPVFFGVAASVANSREEKKNLELLKEMLGGNVQKYFEEVYHRTYEFENAGIDLVGLASTYSRAIGEGIGKWAGFTYDTDALFKMHTPQREQRLFDAFDQGQQYGISFLTKAISDDRIFSDSWNLDIGEKGEPTYVIRIDASNKWGARTKNDVYATFINKNGTKSPEVRLTFHMKTLDFIFYQDDPYCYALNLGGEHGEITGWTPENVASVELTLRPKKFQPHDAFLIKKAAIYYHGKVISSIKEPSADDPIELTEATPVRFLLKNE